MTDLMGGAAPDGPHGRRRCTGTSKQTGQPCKNAPIPGATVCRFHGGAAPQVVAAAERRQQEAAAEEYVAKYGVARHIDWHDAIPQGIDETYGNVIAMRDLVQRLAPEQLAWGRTEVVEIEGSQFPGVNTTYGAGIHPWVVMYGQERDRLHRMSVDAGKLGLEARRQAWAERDARDFGTGLRAVLVALDVALRTGQIESVDPEAPGVKAVIAGALRTLEPAA